MKVLNLTLQIIGFIQILLGLVFLLVPRQYAEFMNLPVIPDWGLWLFAMMAARFIGYGIGMFAASRDPIKYQLWIDTMIGIQCIDWIATLVFLSMEKLTLADVTTAAILPPIFIIILMYYRIISEERILSY